MLCFIIRMFTSHVVLVFGTKIGCRNKNSEIHDTLMFPYCMCVRYIGEYEDLAVLDALDFCMSKMHISRLFGNLVGFNKRVFTQVLNMCC